MLGLVVLLGICSIVMACCIKFVVLLFSIWNGRSKITNSSYAPGWNERPKDLKIGDLDKIKKHGSLHNYLLHLHQNGDKSIAVFWWGQQRVVSICSPDMFKDVIKLTDRPKELFTLLEPIITADSIQYANGQEWENRRKWLYQAFKQPFLESYIPIFVKIANETADLWSMLGATDVIELPDEFLSMTIKGITRTCYGNVFDNAEEVYNMTHVYYELYDEIEQLLKTGPHDVGSVREKQLHAICEKMKRKLQDVIDKRCNEQDKRSIPFIDALLQSGIPEKQVIAEALTFLIGGLHNTGYLLAWTVHYLTINKHVYHELLTEMKSRVGSNCTEKLKNYIFDPNTCLRYVINESLRLTVISSFAARYSEDDIFVGGHLIPARTPILMALGVSLRSESNWKAPEKFDHTRFCTLQGKNMLSFAPFGHGRRKCPGYQFAYIEVGVFLTILLQRFQIEPVEKDQKVEQFHGYLTTTPKQPLKCYIYPLT